MSRRPKDKGTDAERGVVRYLQTNGWPAAERRALRGSADCGDITGTPGICWEVKYRNRQVSDTEVTNWLAETETERLNAGAAIGVLVIRRVGVGEAHAGRWWAIVPASALLGSARHDDIPVRLLLADLCTVLRAAGYGQPMPAGVAS
ncbi:hypothetical protein ACQEU3_47115 [Spirillospora sp. CA-253888]